MTRALTTVAIIAGLLIPLTGAEGQTGLPEASKWILDPVTGKPPAEPAWPEPEPAPAPVADAPPTKSSAPRRAEAPPAAAPPASRAASKIVRLANDGTAGRALGKLVAGQTAILAPGDYQDCAVIYASGVTIKAELAGTARFVGTPCQRKAQFVITGSDVVIDGIGFANARVGDKNGAGIRFEGRNLTVRNSVFRDSEQGILTASKAQGAIVVENSRFERVGSCARGCAHGIYVSGVDKLIVRNSTFRDIRRAHHIKSRAHETHVLNNDLDDTSYGTASFLIDLPNGGSAIIRGNRLVKGPKAENRGCVIAIGKESTSRPFKYMVIEDNRVTSQLNRPTSFVCNIAKYPLQMKNNRQTGSFLPQAS